MEITRIVNGTEMGFKLIEDELKEAWREQEYEDAEDAITSNMANSLSPQDYAKFKNNAGFIEEASAEFYMLTHHKDMDFDEAVNTAFKDTVEDFAK